MTRLIPLCALVALVIPTRGAAAPWPYYRGPDRDGHSAENSHWTGGAWLPDKPAWGREVGHGATSPIAIAGRVYVMGWSDGQDYLWCLDAASGAEIWVQRYKCPEYGRHHRGDENLYRGPSATPAYDEASGCIYTLSIDGDLNCWDTNAAGRKLWGLNLHDAFKVGRRPDAGGGVRDYGYTSSPLVIGQTLIVEVGGEDANLVALDKMTGKMQWQSECKDPAGHNSGPVPMVIEGIPCLAAVTQNRLLVCRTDAGHEGETLATYDWQTAYANNVVGPVVLRDTVILTSNYNLNRTVRIKIEPGKATELWRQDHFSKVCTPVIHQGRLYFAWHKLRCADVETGQTLWTGGSFGDDASCIVTADDRLIVWGRKKVALVQTDRTAEGAYTELSSRGKLAKTYCWPHVVLSDGRLLLKDSGGSLQCFDLGAQTGQ